MWLKLFAFHYPGMAAYQGTDQAFIDEWDAAIDMYGQIFSGVTLVATMGDKLPDFDNNSHPIPAGFSGDCTAPTMTCAAVTTILSYFVEPTAGGANAKATQTSSFNATRATISLGIESVKLLSQNTAQLPAPSAQILGGIQFDQSFADNSVNQGCTAVFPPDSSDMPAGCIIPATCTTAACLPVACIPQACLALGVTTASLASYQIFNNVPAADLLPPKQALYNLLNIYFDGTAVASSFGGTQGTAPLNYVQIFSQDIQYAEANVNTPAQVVEAGGVTVATTAQALLNLASQKLLTLAEPTLPAITPGGIVPGTLPARRMGDHLRVQSGHRHGQLDRKLSDVAGRRQRHDWRQGGLSLLCQSWTDRLAGPECQRLRCSTRGSHYGDGQCVRQCHAVLRFPVVFPARFQTRGRNYSDCQRFL